jgi:hypothetical protein
MTEKEVSSEYGLSLGWLRKLRYSKKSASFYKFGRAVYYTAHDIEDWVLNHLKPVD